METTNEEEIILAGFLSLTFGFKKSFNQVLR